MKLCMLPQPVGVLKLLPHLFRTINQDYLRDFIKYTFNIGAVHTLINLFFKHDMRLDTTKLNVWLQFKWTWPSLKVTMLKGS